jgi:hypothetical protein
MIDDTHITNPIPAETAHVQAQATVLFARVLDLRTNIRPDLTARAQNITDINDSLLSMLASTIKISDGNFRTHCVAFALIIRFVVLRFHLR